MPPFINLTGQRFGKWTVLSKASNGTCGKTRWFCRCECGRERIVYAGGLRSGNSKGCISCHNRTINMINIRTTHGQTGTRLFGVWAGMIQRCEDSNQKDYKYYGGRGIKVCSEWRKSFMAFRKWALEHGYKDIPGAGHGNRLSIDRIDNDGNYSPDNCQILTVSENAIKGRRERGKPIGSNFSNSNAPHRCPG